MNSKYRSILVPLDGSELAENALPMALSIARHHDAALHIMHVYVPVAGVEGEHAVRYDEALDRELMRQAQQYLDDVVARVAAVPGIRATGARLEGHVADTIAHHAAAVGADLLVMTTHGRGPFGRFWLGSVSDELVRKSRIPILFVGLQGAVPRAGSESAKWRVLIPLDGSSLAESILEPLLTLWDSGHTEYTLLQVVRPSAELNYGSTSGTVSALNAVREREQQQLRQAREYLETVAARLGQRSLIVHTRAIAGERAASAILEHSNGLGADLIALVTRGRGGLKRLLLGSVADKVLRGADTAIFTYRPVEAS